MTIRYEINPPKISNSTTEQIEKLEHRIEKISHFCDGIHVTESVLGIPRISPIVIARKIKQDNPKLKVTVSLRTIDKTIDQIHQVLKELIENMSLAEIKLIWDGLDQGDKKAHLTKVLTKQSTWQIFKVRIVWY